MELEPVFKSLSLKLNNFLSNCMMILKCNDEITEIMIKEDR